MVLTSDEATCFAHPFLLVLIVSLLFQICIGWSIENPQLRIGPLKRPHQLKGSFIEPLATNKRKYQLTQLNNQRQRRTKELICDDDDADDEDAPLPFRRAILASSLAAATELFISENYIRPGFRRVRPTQFIAALGDPQRKEGKGVEKWGVWERDPGPRGIPFDQFAQFVDGGRKEAEAGWPIDTEEFWLEEHGVWIETPRYDLEPRRYLVTGGRGRTGILTVYPADESGEKRWALDGGVLYDVTHLPCRSARYIVDDDKKEKGSPINARKIDFPVKPGAEMPMVEGYHKQDYAVLIVTGVEVI